MSTPCLRFAWGRARAAGALRGALERDDRQVLAERADPTQTFDDPVLTDGNRYDYRVVKRSTSDALFCYHTDHLGTPIAMTDGSSTFVWKAELRPFGDVQSLQFSTISNNLRFPGQYFDSETGLHQNWFRDYAPKTGRYQEADPLGQLGGTNTYSYAEANPARWTDRLGLWSPGGHDALFWLAFRKSLSPADLARLQQSSRAFDSSHQSAADSFLHSMRQANQSAADAIRLRDEFINNTLAEARRLAQSGDRNAALDRLGEACHPIMDSSSPIHTNPNGTPRVWNPWWPFGHSPTDFIGDETKYDLTPDIIWQQYQLLTDAYRRVFAK